jgi:hypothetical protein
MPSPSDRFTQIEKVAIFLIAIGQDKTRQALADLDFGTIEQINRAMAGLGELSVQERAAVMIEFGDLFFKGIPLKSKLEPPPSQPTAASLQEASPGLPATSRSAPINTPVDRAQPEPTASREGPPAASHEQAARHAMEHLRERVDPTQIDWGRAGYDFGEGFRGPTGGRDR